MGRKILISFFGGNLGILIITCMLLPVTPLTADSSPISSSDPNRDSSVENIRESSETYQVTLITGDTIIVSTSPEGERQFTISPADPENLGQQFLTIEKDDYHYIIPDTVDLERVDMELFNIDYLIKERYHEEPTLPLLIEYQSSLTQPEIQSLGEQIEAMGFSTQVHSEVYTVSSQFSYQNISDLYTCLISQPELEKIWLDKKIHVAFGSVRKIGADSWWDSGYRGNGISIAILDTGIDSTHPALDDLDDDPVTNDPKVVINTNFSDDVSFEDLHGHGTHVAGIAAGTFGGGYSEQGVSPGAYLWNVKVINQYGWGQSSWIINALNFVSLGPDGVAGTGDEADIVNMSLGSLDRSDGTDPLSQAVNLAVERGLVVAVAAGNSGSTRYTIGTPGVAEKAITVGATNIDDTMASFSSRGPTVDMRIKPDIVAPGVDILSAIPGGDYQYKSGTSMAAPHVAGAAALLLDAVERTAPQGMSLPQFVKDALMCSAEDLGFSVYDQGSGRLDLHNTWGSGSMVETEIDPIDLSWSPQIIPSSVTHQIAPGTDVALVKVAPNGDIFVVDTMVGNVVYKSIDGGRTWTASLRVGPPGTLIVDLEISPSYETDNIVMALVDGPPAQAYISTNGGVVFSEYGGSIMDMKGTSLAISPTYAAGSGEIIVGTINPVAVSYGDVYIWNRNGVLNWTAQGLNEDVTDVAFSPNYPIDGTIVVVSSNSTGTYVHTKVSTLDWDSTIGPAVGIATATGDIIEVGGASANQIVSADMAFPNDFNGALIFNRTLYVAVRSTQPDDKIYRVRVGADATAMDPTGQAIADDEYTSLAYSGNNATGTLFAGNAALMIGDSAQVFRCENLASESPTWLPAFVPPTGTALASGQLTYVALSDNFAGSNKVYAGTLGTDSALSVSEDGGVTFYQVGLIGTIIAGIDDFQMAGPTEFFLATNDGGSGADSVWKTTDGGMSWCRVLAFATTEGGIVRVSPNYAIDNTIYFGDIGGTGIMISTDSGATWAPRTCPTNIADMVLKDQYKLYVASATEPQVFYTENAGWVWHPPATIGAAGAATDIELDVSTGHILVGTSTGSVYLSTDGNISYVPVGTPLDSGHMVVSFDDSYSTTNILYAASTSSEGIYRLITSTGIDWSVINTPEAGYGIYGLEMDDGSLFAVGTDGVNSKCWWTSNPSELAIPAITWYTINPTSSMGLVFNRMPQAFTAGYGKLWAIDTNNPGLHSCTRIIVSGWINDVLVTPASLSFGAVDIDTAMVNGTFTFLTGSDARGIILTATLTDIASGIDYSGHVNLTLDSFTIPVNGKVDTNLNIDLSSLPASLYSGRITAVIDGDSQKTIHAIFGFTKVAKITVHKIDINGNPAQGHPVWAINAAGTDRVWMKGVTDAAGNVIFDAVPSNLHVISYGQDEANQVGIWTASENIDMSEGSVEVTLDERDTFIIDFSPNKPEQIPAAKQCKVYYYDYENKYISEWSSSWWYPDSFTFRISPKEVFDTSFRYSYYPTSDFLPDNPELINTGEWHNLVYSATGINSDITFVADYNSLVHRHTSYNVALQEELAYWNQYILYRLDNYYQSFSGFQYTMNAPQERSEWLTPDPADYRQEYRGATGGWRFSSDTMEYAPDEYILGMGGHPIGPEANMFMTYTVPAPTPTPTMTTPPPTTTTSPTPTPTTTTPPPTTTAPPPTTVTPPPTEGNYSLYIYGNVFKDNFGNRLYGNSEDYTGNITVYCDGTEVHSKDITDYFSNSISFEHPAEFTIEIWGNTPLALSGQSCTRMDIKAEFNHDFRPPQLRFRIPGINTYGIVPGGQISVMVDASDDNTVQDIKLKYSLDDGANWIDTGVPTYADDHHVFNLGILDGTFVSLLVDAWDDSDNHIQRYTNRAFYVGSSGFSVRVDAPNNVASGSSFIASLKVDEVTELSAAQYDIRFDPAVIGLYDITDGLIDATVFPVPTGEIAPREIAPGHWRVVQSLVTDNVSGSGYLAELHFNVIGAPYESSDITITDGLLSGMDGEIPASWIGKTVHVSMPGDANEDGVINVLDITKIAKIILEIDTPTSGADCNLDGEINVQDITYIAKKILGFD